ncbi:MAG: valine--tRNA ligase [Clostridia bacterium]|nr:valine--tRNA ligase [Clostridia bacterium]
MLDKRYNFLESEKKWQDYWQKENIYKFDENSNKKVYSIDTPPPTVNGKIHMGHLSSYIHIETIARYQRMMGKNVYFPFGFDDNGLPTERYVEKQIGKKAYELPREEFIDKCLEITKELEKEFFNLYISAGFSANFKNIYSSIDSRAQTISQKSFLELYKKGKAYYAESPTLWCTECRCAVAQSELDSEDINSTFNYIKFYIVGEDKYIEIATTRPEMLSACVCVFINPKDEKNAHLLNKKLIVPIYNFEVSVLADEQVDLEKGSGVVMCCTFGDTVDKEWQRKYSLPIKEAFNNAGVMNEIAGEFAGLNIIKARKAIIEKLKELDLLIKQDEICHAVSTHERCGTPIEIVVKKQWFIDVISDIKKIYKGGEELNWYPKNMQSRFLNWVENYSWNWCISRQRYFGVPIPVWYCADCGEIITPDESQLPVNPLKDTPKACSKCGSKNFIPERDVFDTWQTSSLTPQISTDLLTKKGLSDKMVPMNLRPNAHDNIRVWDFYTVVKSLLHFNKLPWKDVMISGYVTASDGSKLAKSKANSKNSPQEIISTYSADVTRYWADNMSAGKDTVFALDNFDNGKKIVNKLWNASKFVLSFLDDYTYEKVELLPIDKWIVERLKETYSSYTKALERYEIAFSLNELEKFFWNFCDNYIEIAKKRLYNPDIYGENAKKSAQMACYTCLKNMLKMYSIYMPHVTEEIYMSYFGIKENQKSIHISLYEDFSEPNKKLIEEGNEFVQLVSKIRQYKSENNYSLKEELSDVTLVGYGDFVKSADYDLKAVGNIVNLHFEDGDKNVIIKK